MKRILSALGFLGAVLSISHWPVSALAENGFVIGGVAAAPEYMGSDDHGAVPLLVSSFAISDVGIEIEGLDIRAHLVDSADWSFGVAAQLDPGRGDDVENQRVALMSEIDLATNLGAFAAYEKGDVLQAGDSLEYRFSGVVDSGDVHGGALLTASAAYTLPMVIPWRFQFEVETSYADEDYMNTYFGVDANDAVSTGLPRYSAGASLRDITLSANVGLFFSPKWGLFSRFSMTRWMGDASDSPIVRDGSRDQYFAGLGLYYRFGG